MVSFDKKTLLQIGNILTPLMLFLVLSIISMGQGDFQDVFVSESGPSLIDPAGYAFAIWGPIFFFLALFVIYQARDLFKDAEQKDDMPYVEQVSVFFMLSTLMSASWYIFWMYRIILVSTISMVLYLVFIIAAYLRLNINKEERDRKERLALVVPWSMYMGWITAATIVSITTFLESINFNTSPVILPNPILAVIVLLVALVIYLSVLLTRNDLVYAGVGIWVLLAIIVQRLIISPVVIEVVITCIIGIVVLSLGMAYQVFKRKKA